MRTIML